ncbi:hypothetical protein AB1Y20_018106 [Prymnesium parvum]|uniref:Uncharacterized protein n=1 Tax=Prymnesium parvum TaxID=97485 RepID=A0AB34JNP3_PRYPA
MPALAASALPALAAALPAALPLPSDCPYIHVSGAGIAEVNGRYQRVSDGKWLAANGASIDFTLAEKAAEWAGAGSGAVWGLTYERTHRYYQPALGAAAESAPGAGWRVRESKKGGKAPPPTLSCASIAESCVDVRARSSGVAAVDGVLFARSSPSARAASEAGGATSYRKYVGSANGGVALLEWVSPKDALAWFQKEQPMWGLLYSEGGHTAKHQWLADDRLPAAVGPPAGGWQPRSTKHNKGASFSIECACGSHHFAAAAMPACNDQCQAPRDDPSLLRFLLLLSTGFEDGGGGVEVPITSGGGGEMTFQMPSSLAKHRGNNGLRVSVTKPFDPPWKAKVALGSFWVAGGMQQLTVSFWAKAEPPTAAGAPLPAPRTDVLDLDDNYEWLGHWEPCTLSTTAWTQCFAPISLSAAHRGHALDVSIVLGHTAGTTLIDDVLVVQQITPPPAPPAPPPPAPPLTPIVLYEDFEAMPRQAWPPADANVSPADMRRVRAAVLPVDSAAGLPKEGCCLLEYVYPCTSGGGAPSSTPLKRGKGAEAEKARSSPSAAEEAGAMWADVPTVLAAHRGNGGARLLVKQAFQPAWRARLDLGTHLVLLGDVKVSFWARAVPPPGQEGTALPLSVDVLDTSDRYAWVGALSKVYLNETWVHHQVRVLLGAERAGHLLAFACVVGAKPGEYMFDEVQIEQDRLPSPLSSGSVVIGFESDEPADAVAAGLAVVDLGGGQLESSLSHASGARTGSRCAMVSVVKAFDPPWHAKLRLGSFRVVDAMLNVTFHARVEAGTSAMPPPFVTVDVIESTSGATQWLGHWQRFNLSANEWRRFEALVPLAPSKRGHVLEVALVVGHAAARYMFDDVSVTQGAAPPPPPPPPDVLAAAEIDFEPPDKKEASPRARIEVAGDGRVEADLSSPLAGINGTGHGAYIRVHDKFDPAWGARLSLGWYEAQRELLIVKMAGKLAEAPPPGSPSPELAAPLPTDAKPASCSPKTEKDTKVEKCTSWCTEVQAVPRGDRCAWCKCRQCAFCARPAPPVEPYVTVDVLDRDDKFQWLGFWQRFNLSATEWRRFQAVVPLPPSTRGHVLEVTVVVGHAPNSYMLDQVSVSQRDSPASALSLARHFEEKEEDDDEDGVVAVGVSRGGVPAEGGGLMSAALRSSEAAHSGRHGAAITVTRPFNPPWLGRLHVGSLQVLLNALEVTFWAKASLPVSLSATVVDASARFEWIAFWQQFNLTTSWQRFQATVELDTSARSNHQLQAGLVMGGNAATYFIDQLTLSQHCANWPEPWLPAPAKERLESGFENCNGALPQLEVAAEAEGALHSELFTAEAARSGRLGALLKVKHAVAPPSALKLRFGTIRLSESFPPSDSLNIAFWARLQPNEAHDADARLLFEVLDVNASHEWLGHWRPCNLTGGGADHGWRRCEVEVALDRKRAGHHLSVSAVLGSSKASYFIDDFTVTQHVSTDTSTTQVLLQQSFEQPGAQPLPLKSGDKASAVVQVATGAAHASAAGMQAQVGPSASAAGRAALALGKFLAVPGLLNLTLWARVGKGSASLSLEVLDESEGFRWLGAAMRETVNVEWRLVTLTLSLGSSLEGHMLDISLAFDEAAATYDLDDLVLRCPARAYINLLNATFEQGPDGIAAVVPAGMDSFDLDVPSPDAGHTGRFGAVVHLPLGRIAKPSDAKVRLYKLTGVAGTLSVSLWIRALGRSSTSMGKVTVDVLDETANFEWLGSWQAFEVSSAWTKVDSLVHMGATRAGHTIDVSLVVGGAKVDLAIDDVVVQAPPIEGAGVPVRALAIDFEEENEPLHIVVVRSSNGKGGTAVGGGSTLRVQLRSPNAALSGRAGALVDVREPHPGSRLVLCRLVPPQQGILKVVFWARTQEKHPAPRISIDVFDVSNSWKWLGAPDEFRLGANWQRFEQTIQLFPSHVGHRLEIGLQVGKVAGILHIDDIEVWAPRSTEGNPPRVIPPPIPLANLSSVI